MVRRHAHTIGVHCVLVYVVAAALVIGLTAIVAAAT